MADNGTLRPDETISVNESGTIAAAIDYYTLFEKPLFVVVAADFNCTDRLLSPKLTRGVEAVPKSTRATEGVEFEEPSVDHVDTPLAVATVDTTLPISENCTTAKHGTEVPKRLSRSAGSCVSPNAVGANTNETSVLCTVPGTRLCTNVVGRTGNVGRVAESPTIDDTTKVP